MILFDQVIHRYLIAGFIRVILENLIRLYQIKKSHFYKNDNEG